MKNKSIILLVPMLLMFNGFGAQGAQAADGPGMTIYVVPTISDEKILPTSTIADSYISNEISVVACPGEYEPASFVIHALDDISSLEIEVTELEGASDFIPSSNIDIRVVKCWYQAGESLDDTGHKLLTPELLLKDDSLVKVEGEENYLKVSDEYIHISSPDGIPGISDGPTCDEFPVQDATTLQPVNIPAGTNKQFWVTVKIADDTTPGIYIGSISLTNPELIGEISLQLEVLPINLSEPYLVYSIYYVGTLNTSWPDGSISDSRKSEQQLRKEMENLINHGITNPTVYQGIHQDPIDESLLRKVLAIRNETGVGNQPLYFLGLGTDVILDVSKVPHIIELAQSYSVTDVYFYGKDEAKGQELLDQRPAWEAVHEAGGKMFVACYSDAFDLAGDLLDLAISYGATSVEETAKWHSVGHKIFNYSNPQVGEEKPETYRRNFGLLLWQADYDGAMNFAYQWRKGNIWNDFDDSQFRDHVFAYPTLNGVIDTIQWEGWREGVDDVRYLTTLLALIEEAKESIDTSFAAEDWLADLKSSDLTQQNLDAIRSQMIDHILYLHPPIFYAIGDKTVNEGELLEFTVSGIDPDGDPLSYSVANLPQGASFVGQTFSWAPTYDQAGTYYLEFTVADSGKPFLHTSQSITITVNDIYRFPWIWFVVTVFIVLLVVALVYLHLARKKRAKGFERTTYD